MAIAFRSKAQNKGSTAAAASVTVTAPANIADDDLLVAFGFYHNSNGVSTDPLITAPTDWTLLDAISETTDTATGRFGAVWIKKASGESGNYAFKNVGANTESMGIIIAAYSGVNPVTNLDVTPLAAHFTLKLNDATPKSPPITTVNDAALVIIVTGSTGTDSTTVVKPTGYTSRSIQGSLDNVTMSFAEKAVAEFGTETPADWVYTNGAGTDDSYCAILALSEDVPGIRGLTRREWRRKRRMLQIRRIIKIDEEDDGR